MATQLPQGGGQNPAYRPAHRQPGLLSLGGACMAQSWPNFRCHPPVAPRREYGTGGISWVGATKVRLRIWVPTADGRRRETKVVRVPDREHGGRGAAKVELEKFIAEVAERSSAAVTPTVTVAEMLEAYLVHCKRIGRTQSTIESYGHAAARLPTTLGAMPLTMLKPRDLDAFYGDLAERLADNTIRQTHAILTAALEQAIKWGWITYNPAKGATAPGRHKPKRSALPLPDVAKMIAAASAPRKDGTDGDVVIAMAIAMAALTGARRGELCGMKWSDIDPATCSITIERQWVPGKGGQYLAPPKSEDGVRSIVLGQLGLDLLERYRDIMRDLLRREPDGWLLSYDGVDADTAARRLGHTKEVMLASYVLGTDDRSIAAAQTIEERLVAQGLPLAKILGAEPIEIEER